MNNREREIFEQAIELGAIHERVSFIEAKCGEDLALGGRLLDLVAAYDEAGSFLPLTAKNVAFENFGELSLREEGPGGFVGRYKLLERIGEGGFGVVYMAEQREPVKRKVALKI